MGYQRTVLMLKKMGKKILTILGCKPLKRHQLFAADDNFKFYRFFKNKILGMVFHENCLLADDSHETS